MLRSYLALGVNPLGYGPTGDLPGSRDHREKNVTLTLSRHRGWKRWDVVPWNILKYDTNFIKPSTEHCRAITVPISTHSELNHFTGVTVKTYKCIASFIARSHKAAVEWYYSGIFYSPTMLSGWRDVLRTKYLRYIFILSPLEVGHEDDKSLMKRASLHRSSWLTPPMTSENDFLVPGLILITFIVYYGLLWSYSSHRKHAKGLSLPPGPKARFLTGNLHQLPRTEPWLTFASWSKIYGKKKNL